MSSIPIDKSALNEINIIVDSLLRVSQTDPELRNFSLKFQLEYAAEKAAFGEDGSADRMQHMGRALKRMIDLALSIAEHVLSRIINYSKDNVESQPKPTMVQSSSVEDFGEGSENWIESGAHLSHNSVSLMATALHINSALCKELQSYLMEKNVIRYLQKALTVDRDTELIFFQEGYRTVLMRLIANLTYNNNETSSAIADDNITLAAVLSGTKIDEENPGLVEWAEFSIRNICCSSPSAKEKIKNLSRATESEINEQRQKCK